MDLLEELDSNVKLDVESEKLIVVMDSKFEVMLKMYVNNRWNNVKKPISKNLLVVSCHPSDNWRNSGNFYEPLYKVADPSIIGVEPILFTRIALSAVEKFGSNVARCKNLDTLDFRRILSEKLNYNYADNKLCDIGLIEDANDKLIHSNRHKYQEQVDAILDQIGVPY